LHSTNARVSRQNTVAADGTKLVAADAESNVDLNQFRKRETKLSIAAAGGVEAISWTIPSARFVLQENTDLSSPKLDGRSGIAGGDEFAIPSHSAHTCRKSHLQTKV
jgi:hypothetical protein